MGLSLKKIGRGISKIAKKNRGGLKRFVKKHGVTIAGTILTGGAGGGLLAGALKSKLGQKAASVAASLGKKARGLETAKSMAPVLKVAAGVRRLKRRVQRLPGGAPLVSRIEGRVRPLGRRLRAVRRAAKGATKAPAVARPRAKRAPPKGGKDFKALSASWRAAGKPGTWLDWVKSH